MGSPARVLPTSPLPPAAPSCSTGEALRHAGVPGLPGTSWPGNVHSRVFLPEPLAPPCSTGPQRHPPPPGAGDEYQVHSPGWM